MPSCSVLVVPERVKPTATGNVTEEQDRPATLTSYDAAMWPSQLKQLTTAKCRRHAALEVDGGAYRCDCCRWRTSRSSAPTTIHRDGPGRQYCLVTFAGSDRHFSRSYFQSCFDLGAEGMRTTVTAVSASATKAVRRCSRSSNGAVSAIHDPCAH
jgi:hypothetical protein